MTRTLAETLAWAGDGAAHLRGLMARMGDDAFAAKSGLPGWSRAHVLTHIARNADGMINLLTWARTGVETPAYASVDARNADIDAGATRTPAAIRDDVVDSSDRLAQAVREMPEKAWAATVRNVQGVEIPATEIPWIRAREMWIHAVDLDVGASFVDLPQPMLADLIADVEVHRVHPHLPRPDPGNVGGRDLPALRVAHPRRPCLVGHRPDHLSEPVGGLDHVGADLGRRSTGPGLDVGVALLAAGVGRGRDPGARPGQQVDHGVGVAGDVAEHVRAAPAGQPGRRGERVVAHPGHQPAQVGRPVACPGERVRERPGHGSGVRARRRRRARSPGTAPSPPV